MYGFLLIIFYIVSLSLIFLILIQNKKGFSHIPSNNDKTKLNISTQDMVLYKITFFTAGLFLLISIGLSLCNH